MTESWFRAPIRLIGWKENGEPELIWDINWEAEFTDFQEMAEAVIRASQSSLKLDNENRAFVITLGNIAAIFENVQRDPNKSRKCVGFYNGVKNLLNLHEMDRHVPPETGKKCEICGLKISGKAFLLTAWHFFARGDMLDAGLFLPICPNHVGPLFETVKAERIKREKEVNDDGS
jgi:hypothetical protein